MGRLQIPLHSHPFKLAIKPKHTPQTFSTVLCLLIQGNKRKQSISRISDVPVKEESLMKQGIVAILNPDVHSSKGPSSSIRRTLSAEVLVCFASAAVDSSSDGEEWGGCIWRNNGHALRRRTDPPPYVHPRLSLEMCTESLGSETGSDYFSSSEWMSEGEKLGHEINGGDRGKALRELSAARCKKSPESPIPPPISGSLRVRSRRENGRLVLEAVSVPQQRHFKVQRGNGRLVLTLINSPSEERVPAAVGGGDGEVMKKLKAIGNSNPQFSGKVIEEGFRLPRMIQSPAATFNPYDYFWRKKDGSADGEKKVNQNRELMMMMMINGGCKEARRRSVSIWNPYCIAT